MARKAKRDLTISEQLARGPVDIPFLMLTLLLLGVGLIMVLSASYATAYYEDRGSPLAYAIAQSRYAILGLVLMYVASKVNYQLLRALSVPLLIGSIILLILVISPLGVVHNDAQRWLKLLIVAGPEFQPSEIAKVAVVLFFSARLSKRDTEKPKKKWNRRTLWGRIKEFSYNIGFTELLPYGAILLIIAALLIKEPHLSGTILVLAAGAAVMFAAGIGLGWFALGGSVIAVALTLIIKFTPYMTARINLWLDPWSDSLGSGFQTIQSLYAIGSGGLLGLGLGQSRQKYLFLPEPENDFIFSVSVEELGFVGGILIMALFMLFVLRGYWLALHARDRFGALVIVGFTTLFAVQVFLNIGVVTNLIPNTGISLPFFSYGGTALMIQLAEVGVILSVSRQIPAPKQD